MACSIHTHEDPMRLHLHRWSLILSAALSSLVMVFGPPAIAADTSAAKARVEIQQRFATPEVATAALVAAVRADDPRRIRAVLGPGSDKLISSGDPVADRQGRARFVAAFDKHSRIEPEGDAKAILVVGENDWPLPFPLTKHGDRAR